MNKPWQKRARLRRMHTKRAKRRQYDLARSKSDRFFPPLYEDKNGVLKPTNTGDKYWKNQANRAVRRSKNTSLRGNGYRKAYDYRWKIY